jgi:hypothetical protein
LKIALGIITKNITEDISVLSFIENARNHDKEIDRLIIAYSHEIDYVYLKELEAHIDVDIIKINESYSLESDLKNMGIDEEIYKTFTKSLDFELFDKVPYSFSRNLVLIKAMLLNMDYLFFVDTDVYPSIVTQNNKLEEIDFINSHLEYLKEPDVAITTSDYSGYFIIPPMDEFYGLKEYMKGLQKESAYNRVVCTDCISYGRKENRQIRDTNKILGGNVAIKLDAYYKKNLPPFFSSTYSVNGERVLTRGEDTLLGLFAKRNNARIVDIDLLIFHDTYKHFPTIPDIKTQQNVKDRLYYASLGWIGRNPFLNFVKEDNYLSKYKEQREYLKKYSKYVAEHLDDDRFLVMENAIDLAFDQLPKFVKQYENTREKFTLIVQKIAGGVLVNENSTC